VTTNIKIIIIIGVMVLIIGLFGLLQKKPRKLNQARYKKKWVKLQQLLPDKDSWPMAIIDADKLLDEALKKRRYKGKSTGERLVAAQHSLSNNDAVWFGHKLRNKLVHEQDFKLRKNDVKNALAGIRQALRDLKAL
jgi:hypothetical protein